MAQGFKGAIVGAVTKDGGKVTVQVVFIDADSARVALLPPTYFQAALLDIGIESLKARARLEALASATDGAALTDANPAELLIAGARAGAIAQVTRTRRRHSSPKVGVPSVSANAVRPTPRALAATVVEMAIDRTTRTPTIEGSSSGCSGSRVASTPTAFATRNATMAVAPEVARTTSGSSSAITANVTSAAIPARMNDKGAPVIASAASAAMANAPPTTKGVKMRPASVAK